VDSREAPLIAAALERLVDSGASPGQIADSVAATWRHVEESLTPILGPQGVTALYKRSLVVTARSHPWLAGLPEGPPNTVDLAALTATMMEQESKEAARTGGELLQTFYGLVNSLIGASLTHRLLRFMWQTF
jgi:hypothetical protein